MPRKLFTPLLVGLAVLFTGSFIVTYFNLYTAYPHLDKVFHVSGGFLLAWFFSVLWADNLQHLTKFQRFIMLMGIAALIGFAWEIMEFSTSLPPFIYHTGLRHYIYGGDLVDTLGDLMADILGAALFALF